MEATPAKRKRTKSVHLTTHERTLLLLYRILTDEDRLVVDAAVGLTWSRSSRELGEESTRRFGQRLGALALKHVSATPICHFVAARQQGHIRQQLVTLASAGGAR